MYHIFLDNKYNPNADIRLYLRRRLTDIGLRSGEPEAVHGTWPAAGDIEKLVSQASGQFVHAATVIKFVERRHFSPVQRLQLILTWTSGSNKSSLNPFESLDRLYSSILIHAEVALTGEVDDPRLMIKLLSIFLIISPHPMLYSSNMREIEEHLSIPPGEIKRSFIDLHSLICFQLNGETVSTYHKSFEEFLKNPLRANIFYMDSASLSTELALISLKYISDAFSGGKPAPSALQLSWHSWWFPLTNSGIMKSGLDPILFDALKSFDLNRWAYLTSFGVSNLSLIAPDPMHEQAESMVNVAKMQLPTISVYLEDGLSALYGGRLPQDGLSALCDRLDCAATILHLEEPVGLPIEDLSKFAMAWQLPSLGWGSQRVNSRRRGEQGTEDIPMQVRLQEGIVEIRAWRRNYKLPTRSYHK